MGYTEQQLRAINCTSNCAVSAGAGSGKTKVLSARFMRLVGEGTSCNRILTITFTKKATAEMKERIHQLLVESSNSDQLKLFSEAYISTVDSFCAEVAKADCLRYGFTSDMKIADENDLEEEFTFLANEYIRKVSSDVVHSLADRMTIEGIIQILVGCALLTNVVEGFNATLFAEEYLKKAREEEKRLSELLHQEAEKFIKSVEGDPKLTENIRILQAFVDGKIQSDEVALTSARGTGEEHQEASRVVKKVFKENGLILTLCKNTLTDEEFIKNTYAFVEKFVNRTISYKRQTGQVTFDDVMQMSLDILENNKKVRTYFKKKFDYVMIDEFQDNNSDHRKLLYLLCESYDKLCDGVPKPENLEKGKFFLVGDDKQSIYRFRGADVSVFNNICRELKETGGEVLELGINFRSTPQLVNHFSDLFEKVMADPTEDYEATFRKLEANTTRQYPVKSRILYHNFHHPKTIDKSGFMVPMATPTQSEAYSIACLIKEMTETDAWLINTDEGTPRRPKYSDIAILLRTSSHQGSFEKALRLRGIPYILAETKALMTEALVCDIYSILSFALYPYDEISKAAYLKGPLCNVSDNDLKAEMENERQEIYNIPLNSSAAAVRYIWYEMRYRLFIISNPANQVFTEHYSWLYALACEYDKNGKTIGQFVDYLRTMVGSTDKLKELKVFNEEPDGVQIMTVHKSKGLGFPIVIVGSMESGTRNEKKCSISKKDNIIYLPLSLDSAGNPSNMIIPLTKEDNEKRELAELKRLFYVASTRTQCHLVYSACPEEKKEITKAETLSDMFEKAFPFDCSLNDFVVSCGIESKTFSLIEEELTFSKHRLERERIDFVSPAYNNCINEQFDWNLHTEAVTDTKFDELENRGEMLAVFDWDSQLIEEKIQAEFGTLVHSFIEERINGKKVKPENDIQEAANMLADNFFNSSFFERISKMSLFPERKFTLARGDNFIEGKIDLMADDGETVIIYDFKTDKFCNPEIHRYQLETYAEAVNVILPGRKTEAWVIYLRNPECSFRIV